MLLQRDANASEGSIMQCQKWGVFTSLVTFSTCSRVQGSRRVSGGGISVNAAMIGPMQTTGMDDSAGQANVHDKQPINLEQHVPRALAASRSRVRHEAVEESTCRRSIALRVSGVARWI